MRLLVDMDGVITNFESGVLNAFRNKHPDKPFIPLEKRTTFYVKDQYPKGTQPLIENIYLSEGFYSLLTPIQGAIPALLELSERHEVYVCTSPLLDNPHCIKEKYEWVTKHLGRDWIGKVIVAKDKTMVQGDVLIDDKPDVKGVQKPTWEHVLYSQPYNAHVRTKKRITWENWKSILNL